MPLGIFVGKGKQWASCDLSSKGIILQSGPDPGSILQIAILNSTYKLPEYLRDVQRVYSYLPIHNPMQICGCGHRKH